MAARIIDGKAIAQRIRQDIAVEAAALTKSLGRPPGLDVVLIGEDPASQVYVRNKESAACKAGIAGRVHRLPAATSQTELLARIEALNLDPSVDGILVQLPLPRALDEHQVLLSVDPSKDVDGFHPQNTGLLAGGTPRFVPCTPLGIQRLLVESGITTQGARAVVLGRSNIVGKPMALLLLQKGAGGDATVTVCHTATRDAAAIAREADILIVAMGKPETVDARWIKPGAAVIDVGIHRRADGTLCGDVRHDEAAAVAGWITPVPGGVGPMTIAMLLNNTLTAARARLEAGPFRTPGAPP